MGHSKSDDVTSEKFRRTRTLVIYDKEERDLWGGFKNVRPIILLLGNYN